LRPIYILDVLVGERLFVLCWVRLKSSSRGTLGPAWLRQLLELGIRISKKTDHAFSTHRATTQVGYIQPQNNTPRRRLTHGCASARASPSNGGAPRPKTELPRWTFPSLPFMEIFDSTPAHPPTSLLGTDNHLRPSYSPAHLPYYWCQTPPTAYLPTHPPTHLPKI
jgi:hypothetical protein